MKDKSFRERREYGGVVSSKEIIGERGVEGLWCGGVGEWLEMVDLLEKVLFWRLGFLDMGVGGMMVLVVVVGVGLGSIILWGG